jgi:hypothetical protein
MAKMSKEGVAKLVNLLCAVYGKDCTAWRLSAWELALDDLSDETALNACKEVLKTHKYASLPTPAEIREIALGDIESVSELAWDSVVRAIRNYGHAMSIEFSDDAIADAIESLGGWEYLCDRTKDEMIWIKKEFIKLYKAIARSGADGGRLIGFYERTNGCLKEEYYVKIESKYAPIAIGNNNARKVDKISLKTKEILTIALANNGKIK